MLDEKEAKRIGVQACVEKIGLEFCKKYEENACVSWGVQENKMFCSVGIDDKEFIPDPNPKTLILSETGFPYFASCNVDMTDGSIEYLECIIPEKKE